MADFQIQKTNTDKRLVFGWANVAIRKDGEQIVDYQGDMFDPEDLEEAAYDYVLHFRDAGEEHISHLRKKAKLVESVVFTKEKMAAMGIPEGIVPEGWWIGFKVHDDTAWDKIKKGQYRMFSIEGNGVRVPVIEKSKKEDSMTFGEMIEKFNPNHDPKTGRFTSGSALSGISNRTISGGGISIHTKSGREPKKGYMVAAYTDRSQWISEADTKDPAKRQAAIKDFMEKNKDVLSDPNNFLGTWYDTESKRISLDISRCVEDKDAAITMGQEYNQIAIWDVANFEEIPTGGSGEF